MTQHKLEDVDKKLTEEPVYKDTELKIDFILYDEDGKADLSNDRVDFSGKNLTSGNDVFDVQTTDQDASNGHTRAVVSPSELDESGIFLFELRWDKDDDGTVTDRIQWKQEVKEISA